MEEDFIGMPIEGEMEASTESVVEASAEVDPVPQFEQPESEEGNTEASVYEDLDLDTPADAEPERATEVTEQEQDEQTQEPPFNPEDLIGNYTEEVIDFNEYQSRFSGAEWFENAKTKTISIFGLGGIGSWTSMLISRFNPAVIKAYDLDTVDASNMSGQFFSIDQITSTKAEAAKHNAKRFSNYNAMVGFLCDVTQSASDITISDVNICGFDNMVARNYITQKAMASQKKVWVIDGRLSMRTLQVFCYKSNSVNDTIYRRHFMFGDDEAEAVVCSMKQTSFMANMIASIISNLYMSICLQDVSRFPYEVPFMIEYDCLTYNFKVYQNGEAAIVGTGKS